MSGRRGVKGLELWCRRETDGYPGVNIVNMTTSWRDGLAFCALIHRFRPDLIDFSRLDKNDVYNNNQLAFSVAERHLGIPALLDPEDMVQLDVPDRLSILTYVSQFYRAFHVDSEKSPSLLSKKRTHTFEHETTPSPSKVPSTQHKPCHKCNFPVSLGDRLRAEKYLFHRSCFRCQLCNTLLTMQNHQQVDGLFSCQQCPQTREDTTRLVGRSLSDEEKLLNLKSQPQQSPERKFVTSRSKFQEARMKFMTQTTDQEADSDVTKDAISNSTNVVESFLIISSTDEELSGSVQKSSEVITISDTSDDSAKTSDKSINITDHSEPSDIVSNEQLEVSTQSPSISIENSEDVAVKSEEESFANHSTNTSEQSQLTNEDRCEESNTSPADNTSEEVINVPIPAVRKKLLKKFIPNDTSTPSDMSHGEGDILAPPSEETYPVDLNPFGESGESQEAIPDSMNPFEDLDDEDVVEDKPKPVVRKIIIPPKISLNPFWSEDSEEEEGLSYTQPRTFYGESSSSSLSSLNSGAKKKKAAPKPPSLSPKSSPKLKKTRKAPSPPKISFSPQQDERKTSKDEANKFRQLEISLHSLENRVRRSKGLAPPPPVPIKRTIKSMPINEVRHELDMIEQQMQGLERQSLHLENIIRQQTEVPDAKPPECLAPESEDLILQLFDVVNEKNELFRRQSELMYLQKQHRLEEEQADLEYQIRCLMLTPETNKSDNDKIIESLVEQLTTIVDQRNDIVETLELDRRRERDEDCSINSKLKSYALDKEKNKEAEIEAAAGQEKKLNKGKKKGKKKERDAESKKVPYFLRSMTKK